jgi:hypothetical protein
VAGGFLIGAFATDLDLYAMFLSYNIRFRCAWRIAATALGVHALLLSCGEVVAAGARVDAGGFESFTLGSLVPDPTPNSMPDTPNLGQQGWVGIDQIGKTENVETAVIQSTIKKAGNRALQVDRAAGVDNRWAVLFGNSSDPNTLALTLPQNRVPLPSQRFMLIDWDMLVADAGGNSEGGELGPYFGVEAWDSASVANTVGLLGSLGVDASTGQVVYQQTGAGLIQNTGQVVDFGVWNHFAILLDYSLDAYRMFLNGEPIGSYGFVDGALGLNRFTDADIAALAIDGNAASTAIEGTAFFDNFRVLDGIPGDFDLDGDVDQFDLAPWKTAFGTTAVGDADGDGVTSGSDFLIWQQNLGVDLVPTVAANNSVPEPAVLILAVLALASGRVVRNGIAKRTAFGS